MRSPPPSVRGVVTVRMARRRTQPSAVCQVCEARIPREESFQTLPGLPDGLRDHEQPSLSKSASIAMWTPLTHPTFHGEQGRSRDRPTDLRPPKNKNNS